ncbi:MAG: hypothetical protein QOF89_1509 [Acidobacteriota bacterium]|jgi:hypothetical protein|nr:hypothetical protein [Acidobacteriota bacterium]
MSGMDLTDPDVMSGAWPAPGKAELSEQPTRQEFRPAEAVETSQVLNDILSEATGTEGRHRGGDVDAITTILGWGATGGEPLPACRDQ